MRLKDRTGCLQGSVFQEAYYSDIIGLCVLAKFTMMPQQYLLVTR